MKICKECNIEKSLTEFYSHPLTKDGRLNRCKECVKSGRRTEKERSMARVRDSERGKNPERLKFLAKNTKRFRQENPDKYKAHKLIQNFLKRNPDCKPKVSIISRQTGTIHLHHPDYSKPNEVVPCTPLEHKHIHSGKIPMKPEYIIRFNF